MCACPVEKLDVREQEERPKIPFTFDIWMALLKPGAALQLTAASG